MKKRMLVTGIFADADSAVDAIHELRRTSFSDDQLGFVVRYNTDEHSPNPLARCIAESLPGVKDILFPPLLETGAETGTETGIAEEHSQVALLVEEKFQHIQKKGQTGIIVNSVIGGTLGVVATLQLSTIGLVIVGGTLAATLATVATGEMIARLLSIGISEHKVRDYEQQFLARNIIFTLKAAGQQQEAQDILRYHRAYSIEVH